MPNQIEQYALGRNAKGQFAYRIKVTGGGWTNWTIVSATDFAAFAALFRIKPLYYQSDGSIASDVEPIGN